jgi:hypothetical protein
VFWLGLPGCEDGDRGKVVTKSRKTAAVPALAVERSV